MSDLQLFLQRKRAAWLDRRNRARTLDDPTFDLVADVKVEGGSGVRRIRIGDFQVISDSLPDYAGYDLGPGSPELQLGALGSCLAHTFLIQAARHEVPIDGLEVHVEAVGDLRAGMPESLEVPVHPRDIRYRIRIDSPADSDTLSELHRNVEDACPVLALLRTPQHVSGEIERSS